MDIFSFYSYRLFIWISRWVFLKLTNVWGQVWIKFSFYRGELRGECFERFQTSLFFKITKMTSLEKGLGPDFLPYIVDLFLSQCTVYTPSQSHLSSFDRERQVLEYTCHGIQPCSEICCGENSFMVGKTSVPPWLCCFFPCPWNVLSVHREKKIKANYLSWKLNLLKISFLTGITLTKFQL